MMAVRRGDIQGKQTSKAAVCTCIERISTKRMGGGGRDVALSRRFVQVFFKLLFFSLSFRFSLFLFFSLALPFFVVLT